MSSSQRQHAHGQQGNGDIMRLKDNGNRSFRLKRFAEAVTSYSEAIRLSAPARGQDDANLRATLFSNRAQCCLNLRLPERARDDALNALASDSTHLKAKVRLGEAYVQLTEHALAAVQFREVAKTTENSKVAQTYGAKASECEKLMSQSKAHSKERAKCETEARCRSAQPTSQSQSAQSTSQCRPAQPTASFRKHESVDFSTLPNSGRCVLVKEDAQSSLTKCGEVLLDEEAFAGVLREGFRASRCHWCFRTLDVKLSAGVDSNEVKPTFRYLVPCSSCDLAVYCSNSCRSSDERHELECGDEFLSRRLSPEALLAVRVVMKTRRVLDDVDPRFVGDHEGIVGKVDSLMTHESEIGESLHRNLQREAHAISEHISSHSSNRQLREALSTDVESALLKTLLQIRVNAVAITDVVASSATGGLVQTTEHKRVAVALFPNIAMVNHSCAPNAFFTFAGRHAQVRNSHALARGDQVCISYGPTEASMPSAKERTVALMEQYHFQCGCDGCVMRSTPVSRFGCPVCHEPLSETKSGGAETVMECTGGDGRPKCGIEMTLADLERAEVRSASLLNEVARDPDNALPKLLKCLRLRSAVFHSNRKEVAEAHDALGRAYASGGDFKQAAVHVRAAVRILERSYGRFSLELHPEYLKLAKLMFNTMSQSGSASRYGLRSDRVAPAELREVLTIALELNEVFGGEHRVDEHRELMEIEEALSSMT